MWNSYKASSYSSRFEREEYKMSLNKFNFIILKCVHTYENKERIEFSCADAVRDFRDGAKLLLEIIIGITLLTVIR